jgi:arylsulfatase A-like enzyme
MYEHSMRVPLVIRGPQIEPGSEFGATVYYQDIMPTTLELAGVPIPDYVEFKSLWPIISQQRAVQYDAIYGAYINWQRMIRKDGYKLIVYPRAEAVELFDLRSDPWELKDLSDDPGQQDRIQAMTADLKALMLHYDDELSFSGVNSMQ